MAMAERDRHLLESLRGALGFGSVHVQRPRKAYHLPIAVLTVASAKAHRHATIPFFEHHLPIGAKRRQFEMWRDAFWLWEEQRPSRCGKGRSACSVEGCDRPVRGRGLCRSHYYRATGY